MKKLHRWFKKYFIPHHHNDFKPHFLRYESTLALLIVIVLIELLFLFQIIFIFNKTNFLASVLPAVLTNLTNEERKDNHVSPLTENELLVKAAQMKAEDMASRGYFAHVSPDGKTPWYWLDQVGYKYSSAGENLAVNFFESEDIAEAWMNSPSHRANIVKANYTEIGIGIARGRYKGENTIFVAQFFGTPNILNAKSESTLTTEKKSTTTPVAQPKPIVPIKTPEPATPIINRDQVAIAPTSTEILGDEVAPAVPATLTTTPADTGFFSNTKSFVQKVLSSPRLYIDYILGGILLVSVLALLLTMFIRFEMAHHHNIARGVGVISVIFLMLFLNMTIFNTNIDLPSDSFSASVIKSN